MVNDFVVQENDICLSSIIDQEIQTEKTENETKKKNSTMMKTIKKPWMKSEREKHYREGNQ
jgi:hypothetical protein